MRRVSRSAITKTSQGLTCVNTPILGTLRHSRHRRTAHPTSTELSVNDLAVIGLIGMGAALLLPSNPVPQQA
jgi:hypothetical protein